MKKEVFVGGVDFGHAHELAHKTRGQADDLTLARIYTPERLFDQLHLSYFISFQSYERNKKKTVRVNASRSDSENR